METINRKILGTFYVYTKEEALEKGIEYKYWKEGIPGEYVITDDDYVVLLLGKKEYETSIFYKMSIGAYWTQKTGKSKDDVVLWEKKRGTQYYNRAMKPFNEWLPQKRWSQDMVRIAVRMLLNKGKIDFTTLGDMFYKNHSNPAWKVRRMFKMDAIQKMMETEIDKQLTKYGITDETIIKDCFLKAMEIATAKKQADTLVKLGVELAKLKGMYPSKTVVTNEMSVREVTGLDSVIEREAIQLQKVRSEREI